VPARAGPPMKAALRGITWNHSRGFLPMVATAQRFEELHPEVEIVWEKRSLQAFADAPIGELAEDFDLLVIDHPSVGEAMGFLLPLDEHLTPDYVTDQALSSVGRSVESYEWDGHRWALAIDAAAPVSCYRLDLLSEMRSLMPRTWPELLELAQRGAVALPLTPVDALMAFYMLCGAAGEEPFLRSDRLVAEQVGAGALAHLADLARACGPECLYRNPIATYELMASGDRIAYCPFAYGYSNYARHGYARELLRFGGLVTMPDGRRLCSTLGGAGLAISRRCTEVSSAVEYCCFVAGAACQSGLYFASGGQPGHRSAWEDPSVNAACQSFFQDTLPVLDEAYLRPRFHGYLKFQQDAGPVLHRFLSAGGDPRRVCNELEQIYRNVRH
jgi:multiple sugar transport system substrate-binding protein